MTIESALIARAQPQMIAAQARDIIRREIQKGCSAEISPVPVSLEPTFRPLWLSGNNPYGQEEPDLIPEEPASPNQFIRLRIWISPEHGLDWNQFELFIKQLQGHRHRAAFEISGNRDSILMTFLVHRKDAAILQSAFNGEYVSSELTILKDPFIARTSDKGQTCFWFRDYFPPPPYSHLLTRPQELQKSPLFPLIVAMSDIAPPAVGLYQVVFQPIPPAHNWHRNVQILLDFEYNIKLVNGGGSTSYNYAQQSPSGDLKQMAWEVENKAHNDKPFFTIALRVGVSAAGEQAETILDSLSTFIGLFQHGGRPLEHLTERDYTRQITPNAFAKLFPEARTYRAGFLVNSLELTGLIHLPPAAGIDDNQLPLDLLEPLSANNEKLSDGTSVGTCCYADIRSNVCFPDTIRAKHTHLIGRTGTGKSTTQEHMVLCDIQRGDGVAVIDPHGDLIERLLCLIPERDIERTIYFNPGDPDWIPIWNPLQRIPGQDVGRTADDLVQAIQSFILKSGWGDRLEHLLRNLFYSIMHLPKGTLLDVSNLLRNKSEESKILRREILDMIENETVRQFWHHDYPNYRKDDLGPPRNKLSKLLVSNTVSLMLSQPESLFNLRDIMDRGMILLVNLSGVGSMVRSIMGCFILSLMHLTALSRSSIAISDRKPFHIHCDEAHRFMTDSLEDLIAETRKYKVSLSLAHQYMSQFGRKKTDAFSSVGSTIIFNVDSRDAGYLVKDLQKKVKVEDLVSLGVGEAIARIGTDIVRFKTHPPFPIPKRHFKQRIIENSRRKYCRPANEVQGWIRRRGERWNKGFSPLSPCTSGKSGYVEEFEYDEFD
jgi:hypothetical protein